jgi:antitoxin (DNA-binding transcriptional repressor) of toxin-antitoxin stability system
VTTSAHAYELSPHASPQAEAVEAAERGQVVYLTRNGEPVAAIVPADVAAAGAAVVEALEDAEDIRAARAALAESGSGIPMSQVWADYADILGPYPYPDAENR